MSAWKVVKCTSGNIFGRGDLPGVEIEGSCPKCGDLAYGEVDLSELRFPEGLTTWFCECGHEWKVGFTLLVADVSPHCVQ